MNDGLETALEHEFEPSMHHASDAASYQEKPSRDYTLAPICHRGFVAIGSVALLASELEVADTKVV